ncbi:MAG: hypothetical protein PVSMB4_14130 [Ktedonobacterales bacterium]
MTRLDVWLVYTGYTLETLSNRTEPEIQTALMFTDVLIEGPFESEGAGTVERICVPSTA